LFVVGGVALVGDPVELAAQWKVRQPIHKGAAFSDDELSILAEFLCQHEIVPIASHVQLVEDDWSWAKRKVRALKSASRQGRRRLTPAGYLWALQVIQTAVSSAMGSLPFVVGTIDGVEIFADEFGQQTWFRDLLTSYVPRWFERGSRFWELLDELDRQRGGHPDLEILRERVQTSAGTSSIQWRSRGPLHSMADGVAALYRRHLKGEAGAVAAWRRLREQYSGGGRPPACMGMDLTKTIIGSIRSVPRVQWPPRAE